jgi:hypothetical protein
MTLAAASGAATAADAPTLRTHGGAPAPQHLHAHSTALQVIDFQIGFASHARHGATIQRQHFAIVAAHEQQSGRANCIQRAIREVGPAAARHDCLYFLAALHRRDNGRRSAGARAKQSDWQVRACLLCAQPVDRFYNALAEQRDIKDISAVLRLGLAQKVKQECRKASFLKPMRGMHISWTMSARAAAVREYHNSARIIWNSQCAW